MRAHRDGSAGDVDYARIGEAYGAYRQPEPFIAAFLRSALGDAASVVNIGAGAGSYEPSDLAVTPVEPSASMRAQRPAHLAAAVDATAERLPFEDGRFDAALATFTVHQWGDLAAGLAEMRRVTRGPALVLTCDPDELDRFWLADYAPEAIAAEASRYPPIAALAAALGANSQVRPVPIPLDCRDGFNEAYYGRPERLLDPRARQACSAWTFVEPQATARFEARLAADLASGEWDRRHGALRSQPFFEGSLKLVVGLP